MSGLTERLRAAIADRYVIERELGQGGMATVYLAHDVKHDRKVALKVLRPELAAVIGADRFLTEIRTTANLQHPHILPLFDSGWTDGPTDGNAHHDLYYVMPFVEGESLRDRLTREKQLPIADAVRIATEVASALDYAHRRGVIHRDIKPENILLHDRQALVADFGIALAVRTAGGSRLTETGLSLGTPHYMSPEQAMGERNLDGRTDVYALGCVLYEMLVGEPPFTGPTAQAIVASVMTEKTAPPSRVRDTVPPGVEQAVLTALQKMPADRQSSAAEFAAQLAGAGVAVLERARGGGGVRFGWRPVAVAVAVLFAGGLLGRFTAPDSGATASGGTATRLALLTPGLGGSGVGGNHRQLALVPDGSAVVYLVGHATATGAGLVVQRLDEEVARPIRGSEFMYAPDVSPDRRWIAARRRTGEAVVFPFTGALAPPAPIAPGLGLFAWYPDGSLLLARVGSPRIERYRPETGALEVLLDSVPGLILPLQVMDGGRRALAVHTAFGAAGGPLVLLDLETGDRTTLLGEAVLTARYARGLLAYAGLNGTVLVRAFDPRSGRLGDAVTTVAQGVSVTGLAEVQFDLSPDAILAYVPEEPRMLVHVDRDGVERPLTEERNNYHNPRFASDGRRLATDFVTTEGRDVWVLDLQQQTTARVTFDRDGHDAEWSPDGRTLTYLSSRAGEIGIYRVTPGGGTTPESLLVSPHLAFSGIWHPNGRDLLTVGLDLAPGSAQDIAVIRNGGRGPIEPLVATRFREEYPALSPDGRWVAFVSDQSGRPEVYVRPWSGETALAQVSQGGGGEPRWSPDGRELFYHAPSASGPVLMAARLEPGRTVTVLQRTELFPVGGFVTSTPHANYDVTPDGRGFVMVRSNPAARIVVIQNLPALVARLSGGSRPDQ